MGVLSSLALAPVKLVTFVGERILESAQADHLDRGAILAALTQLNDDYDRGLVDDDTFAVAEDELMERLELTRTRNRA